MGIVSKKVIQLEEENTNLLAENSNLRKIQRSERSKKIHPETF